MYFIFMGKKKNAGTVIQMTGLDNDNNAFWVVVTHERPVLAGGIRVCDYCCKVVLRYAQQSVSTGEVKVFRDEIRNMSSNQLDIDSGSFEFSMWSPLAKRRSLTKEDLTLPQQRLCIDIHFILFGGYYLCYFFLFFLIKHTKQSKHTKG